MPNRVMHTMRSLSTATNHRCFGTVRPSRSSHKHSYVISAQDSSNDGQACAARRRDALIGIAVGIATPALLPLPARAGFKKELKKKKVPLEEYTLSDVDGLRYYDVEQGRGKEVKSGDKVTVHFDCKFRGIDAVSSRYARTLGGNRTVAEPFEMIAGEPISVRSKKAGEVAGGLYAGGTGPKPPPALSTAVLGMKQGGRRTVYVDNPELGYIKGNQEIPAGAPFELEVEVLSVL